MRRGLSRRVACSLVRVSIGIEGRWVMGCSSCWTAVRRECWWSSLGESRSYNVAGWVGGEWVVGFVSTVFTDKTEEVYLHRGWGGLSGLFTWEVFTTIELFTGRSGVLRLSAGAGSSVGVPGQLGSIGCSNIDASGLWTGGMIGRIGACCWFAGVLHKLYALGFAWPRRLMHQFGREGWFVCSQHSS